MLNYQWKTDSQYRTDSSQTDIELVNKLKALAAEVHDVGEEMLKNHPDNHILTLQLRVSALKSGGDGFPNATVRFDIDGTPILLFGDMPKHS